MNFKQRIIFFFQGKFYLKIVMVLLSAVAIALCGVACTGFTNNTADYLARGLLNYGAPFTCIQYDHNKNSLGDQNVLSQGIINIFEESGLEFLYGYNEIGDYETGVSGGASELLDFEDEHNIRRGLISGSQAMIKSFGFTVVAGKYPEVADEIAIDEGYYEMFKRFGYRNVRADYVLNEEGDYYYNGNASAPTEQINDYSDIIGKTLVMNGDIETGEHLNDRRAIYEAKIVGVIDTSSMETDGYYYYLYPSCKMYVSEAWREKFFYKDGKWQDENCWYLYTTQMSDYETAYKIASATLKACDYVEENGEKYNDSDVVEANGTVTLLDGRQTTHIRPFMIYGLALGVVAIALQIFISDYSLKERRKQIGVLQSMGASRKRLFFTFFAEAIAIGVVIFLIAAPLAYGIFYGELRPGLYNEKYNVYLIEYNNWNWGILGALSLLLPMITTSITAEIFLKRAPIENIRNEKKPARSHISHAEAKRNRDLKKLQELKDKYENK